MRSATYNVASWTARHAAIDPERLLLADAERTLDAAALDERCARLAGWLADAGVRAGDRVVIVMGNRSAFVETVLAAARIGALSVPLNARLAPPEIARLLDDCTPAALLFDPAHASLVERACDAAAIPPRIRLVAGGAPDAYEDALACARPEREVVAVAPDDPMMILYTSGTTGVAKGALLPHRKTFFNALNAVQFFGIGRHDRVLVPLPLFHSFGLVILTLPALYAGGFVRLEPRFDPETIWQRVRELGVTYFGAVPTMFQALHDVLAAAGNVERPPSLRFLFSAGAAIPVELIRAYEAHGLVVKQGFGQTETSILCCLDARDAIRKAGSVGRPVFHVELRIVDANDVAGPVAGWRDVAPGERGEIVVRGPITMLGYWGRPAATAETLREGGWLRTGDLATVDEEGFVTLAGRSREMFISGGENVYPAEVEAAYAAHPDVLEVAIVGVPDARWGEVGRAYVVLRSGAELAPDALREFGRERLASFKIPASFVALPALPRTVTGKVQKHLLAGAAATGAPRA